MEGGFMLSWRQTVRFALVTYKYYYVKLVHFFRSCQSLKSTSTRVIGDNLQNLSSFNYSWIIILRKDMKERNCWSAGYGLLPILVMDVCAFLSFGILPYCLISLYTLKIFSILLPDWWTQFLLDPCIPIFPNILVWVRTYQAAVLLITLIQEFHKLHEREVQYIFSYYTR